MVLLLFGWAWKPLGALRPFFLALLAAVALSCDAGHPALHVDGAVGDLMAPRRSPSCAFRGHWSSEGHLPAIRASGQAFLAQHPAMEWVFLTDQEVVPDLHYPHEHAAGGETSLLMAIRPDLVDLSKTTETDGVLRTCYAAQPEHLQRRRDTTHKHVGVLTGVEDNSNDPETTASAERGRLLLEAILARIAERARASLPKE